jgi:hypothetical protein
MRARNTLVSQSQTRSTKLYGRDGRPRTSQHQAGFDFPETCDLGSDTCPATIASSMIQRNFPFRIDVSMLCC